MNVLLTTNYLFVAQMHSLMKLREAQYLSLSNDECLVCYKVSICRRNAQPYEAEVSSIPIINL